MAIVLTLNAGSSSLKAELFAADGTSVFKGMAGEIGGGARLVLGAGTHALPLPDHAAALAALLAAMERAGHGMDRLDAVAHRVVHGGPALAASTFLTPEIRAQAKAAVALAPLHNPTALAVIDAMTAARPDLTQIACFDTAFHATIPEVAQRYALPDWPETEGIRRYGFHGLSYASLAARLPGLLGARLPRRLLALHLGNGASLCAIRDGISVASTMGYSPLEGLTMGTRSGDIDGNAVLEIARRAGIDGAARILNRESGLKGLGGASDMRALEAAGTPEAAFAIAHFVYWALRHAGAMIASMGGCDALAFTGGIGENSARVRAGVMDGLGWLGLRYDPEANAAQATRLDASGSAQIAIVVPAAEEAWMAEDARRLLG